MSKQLYTLSGIEAALDAALEHASHGWHALEKERAITYTVPDAWPPHIKAEIGSAEYHIAAMIAAVKRAYDMVAREKEHEESVMEKVNKALKR